METDYAFTELFENRPQWLGDLIGTKLPPIKRARPLVFKSSKVECDLVLEPKNDTDPHLVVEFQLYYDASIYVRTELARCLLWKRLNSREHCRKKSFQPREVKSIVIFGDETHVPTFLDKCSHRSDFLLESCIEALAKKDPDAILPIVLEPITVKSKQKLESSAPAHYLHLRNTLSIPRDERHLLSRVYKYLLLQRFNDKTKQDFEDMIAELVPLDKTRVGKELIAQGRLEGQQEGRQEGRQEEREEIIKQLKKIGMTTQEISDAIDMPFDEVAKLVAE